MEINVKPGADTVAVIAEPGALVFATRKEWRELPESCLDEISHYETEKVFKGTYSVFFLLRNMNPVEYLKTPGTAFRLVKVSMDEDGKQAFSVMDLSAAEGHQLTLNQLTLWD